MDLWIILGSLVRDCDDFVLTNFFLSVFWAGVSKQQEDFFTRGFYGIYVVVGLKYLGSLVRMSRGFYQWGFFIVVV